MMEITFNTVSREHCQGKETINKNFTTKMNKFFLFAIILHIYFIEKQQVRWLTNVKPQANFQSFYLLFG